MENFSRVCISMSGRLQGVGFRAFALQLAHALGLTGWLRQEQGLLMLELEGDEPEILQALSRLRSEMPPGAQIDHWQQTWLAPAGYHKFCISPSVDASPRGAPLRPDLAPCPDCWHEWEQLGPSRFHHPLIACSSCGPHFSLVNDLYSTHAGANGFPLCHSCPDRCVALDPDQCTANTALRLMPANLEGEAAIALAAEILRSGGIVALQSVGGFQLLVDARDDEALHRLRQGKQQPWRPWAVLVQSRIMAQALAYLTPEEWALMRAPPAPIVLSRARSGVLSTAVHPDTPQIGLMLPPTPLHRLLIEAACCPLAFTSGNLAGEPTCISFCEAEAQLADIADVFLIHPHQIAQRLDDSVAQIVAGQVQLLRRARGYVPEPLPVAIDMPEALALGAGRNNSPAFSRGRELLLTQPVGDLDRVSTLDAQAQILTGQLLLYSLRPQTIALDAQADMPMPAMLDRLRSPRQQVGHHRSHIAAVMAEHGLTRERLLALAWDGQNEGGEVVLLENGTMQRVATILPFPLPGGDLAAQEPRRALLGLMFTLLGPDAFEHELIRARFRDDELAMLGDMLMNAQDCPLTHSIGKLFDAVASLLDLRQLARFDGEAAQQVQFCATTTLEAPPYPFKRTADEIDLDWRPMLCAMLEQPQETASTIAARFHATLCAWAGAQLEHWQCRQLLLAGGCFQNRLLVEMMVAEVARADGRCWWPQRLPASNGALAAGQLYALALQSAVTNDQWLAAAT